jgi:hypothetical protein
MKIYDMVKTAADRLLSSEEKLNGLDKESGDGDCGSTMARGAQGIVEQHLVDYFNSGLSILDCPFGFLVYL